MIRFEDAPLCSAKLRSCTKVVEKSFDVKEWSGKEERYEEKTRSD